MPDPGDEQARSDSRARLPHAVLDRDSRMNKARKIVALIGDARFQRARRVLEIGCGSGVIASTLAMLGGGSMAVDAVDVVDNRLDRTGYAFHLVEGTTLPFDDYSFDLIVTNHVIEHVGDHQAQLAHLAEIRRILAPGGIVYLAVPNKWRLVEPHFRLPLLSWFTPGLSDRYVRLCGRGTHYDCLPLSSRQALDLFEQAQFTVKDVTVQALHETLAIEFPERGMIAAINRGMPDWLIRMALPIIPTYIYLLRPDSR